MWRNKMCKNTDQDDTPVQRIKRSTSIPTAYRCLSEGCNGGFKDGIFRDYKTGKYKTHFDNDQSSDPNFKSSIVDADDECVKITEMAKHLNDDNNRWPCKIALSDDTAMQALPLPFVASFFDALMRDETINVCSNDSGLLWDTRTNTDDPTLSTFCHMAELGVNPSCVGALEPRVATVDGVTVDGVTKNLVVKVTNLNFSHSQIQKNDSIYIIQETLTVVNFATSKGRPRKTRTFEVDDAANLKPGSTIWLNRQDRFTVSSVDKNTVTLDQEITIQEGYTTGDWSNFSKASNIIAKIKGVSSEKALLLLTHYDSHPHSSLGASDAASGVATILEGIRAYLNKKNIPKKIDLCRAKAPCNPFAL